MPHINTGLQYTNRFSMALPDGFVRGATFANVHFRINTGCYHHQLGFQKMVDGERFYQEVRDVLAKHEFEPLKDGARASRVFRGEHTYLHMHPDDISGVVPIELIPAIHETIKRHSGIFTARWTDVYETKELITPDELQKRVTVAKLEVEKMLLSKLKTARTTHFVKCDNWAQLVTSLQGFQFIGHQHDATIHTLVSRIVEGLIFSGKVIQCSKDGGDWFRAANKTELNKLKRRLAVKPQSILADPK